MKSAEPALTDEEADAYELTNIRVKEVSLVDRAANRRRFLVTKRAKENMITEKNTSAEPVVEVSAGEPVAAAVAAPVTETPAAEVEKTEEEMLKEMAAKDAKDKAEYLAAKAAEAIIDPPAVVVVPSPVVTPPPAPAPAPAQKNETVTVYADGSVQVVETASPVASAQAIAAVQAAWLGGIGAIRARLDMVEAAVRNPSVDSVSGTPSWPAYAQIDYLRDMLYGLYDIGGPEWEMEAAAQAGAASMFKAGRAISGKRMGYLREAHKHLANAQAMFAKVFEDMPSEDAPAPVSAAKNDIPVVITTKTEPAQVAPPVVSAPAVVAAPVASVAPATDPTVLALIKQQNDTITSLLTVVKANGEALTNARATVRSNALTGEPVTSDNDLTWDRDMASESSRARSRLRR